MAANVQCLLDEDGKVACWGDGSSGMGPSEGQGDFQKIAISDKFGCGIADGEIVCWEH